MIMSSVVFFEGLEKFNAPEVLQEVAVPDWRAAEARILKAFPRSDDSWWHITLIWRAQRFTLTNL